ncbi:MAG TPA: metalloregulator ArsR/SmtB family transcription factor [Opitutus sp.]|nr:metalloregulator ArsR/SmtB family transcription factor [Opitutus sp.]
MSKSRQQIPEESLMQIARRFAVLSEPMRLRLLHVLMRGEQSVNTLAELTGGTQANISRHLQTLAEAGMVSRRKQGLHVFYDIADRSIFKLCDLVCGSLEKQLAEKTNSLRTRRIA